MNDAAGHVAAIVLAAGRGTRFGPAPKLLAELNGKPLVRHAVETALASGADPVIVVTGHRHADVAAALREFPITQVVNRRYADGLSTSLQAGFAALPGDAAGAVILLGDMPGVTVEVVAGLIGAWEAAARPAAAIPLFAGRRGNPVLLSRALLPEIERLSGDAGAGRLLRARDDVVEWESGSPAVALDIDTPEALAQAACASTTPPSTAE